jgi:hypothetical protein
MKILNVLVVSVLCVLFTSFGGYCAGIALNFDPMTSMGVGTAIGAVMSFIPAIPNTLAIGLSPQNKLQMIGKKMGQNNIVSQQGTTRHIWDTLPLVAGQLYYRFFDGVNGRVFPFTNLTDNKLEAAESLACQFMHLSIINITKATNVVNSVTGLTWGMLVGSIDFTLANTTVMKPISLLSFDPMFNRMPNNTASVYKLFTQPAIMPQLSFILTARFADIPAPAQGDDNYVRLTIEGTGSILSPKGTM